MTSQIDIANRALLAIGARIQVSSINPSDGSAEANAVSTLWQPTFEQLARSAQWNCLRKQTELSLLQAAQGTPENQTGLLYSVPPVPWLYTYSYPSDCLAFQYVVPALPTGLGSVSLTTIANTSPIWLPNGGQIPYAVSTVQVNPVGSNNPPQPILGILTNQTQAIGVYTANYSNPSLWDSQFQAAMVAALAAFLAPALSLSMPLMQVSIGTADKLIAQARASDGREGVTVMDHVPDWIRAREGGQGFGAYGGGIYNNYSDIAWPRYGV